MEGIQLLWATGQRTDVYVDSAQRTIQYSGPDGATSFRDTRETSLEGLDIYAESGCGWTRLHVNQVLSSVLATAEGKFAAWATHEGVVMSAGRYHALPTAKAAADLEAQCVNCRRAPWVPVATSRSGGSCSPPA
jgi:hypothetical protein